MFCRDCQHFTQETCRRYAPAPLTVSRVLAKDPDVVPLWPRVAPTDFCGEFTAKQQPEQSRRKPGRPRKNEQ